MGYEIRLHVVQVYSKEVQLHQFGPTCGGEIAFVELSKIGDGPFQQLLDKHKHNKTEDKFALWPRNPDRQQEAVEKLREWALGETGDNKEYLEKLSNDIEDGYITTDKYGANLPMIDIDDVILALKAEMKIDPYRRIEIALVMLETVKHHFKHEHEEKRLKVIPYGH